MRNALIAPAIVVAGLGVWAAADLRIDFAGWQLGVPLTWLGLAGVTAALGGMRFASVMRERPWRQRPLAYWLVELLLLPIYLLLVALAFLANF